MATMEGVLLMMGRGRGGDGEGQGKGISEGMRKCLLWCGGEEGKGSVRVSVGAWL